MVKIFLSYEYLPEDGRKRSKNVTGLLHDCVLLYIITLQLLEYIANCLIARNVDNYNGYINIWENNRIQ
jgi:hypothetical protein